eukprot:s658_g20.t1
MSELGCADGCGRRGCKGVKEWGEEPLGMSELGCADGCGRRRRNGWGEGVAGYERAWMRGRLRTAWLQGSGWKWVGTRSLASLDARMAADGVRAREWLEMGWDKEPLGMSGIGCVGPLRTAWKWVGRKSRWA